MRPSTGACPTGQVNGREIGGLHHLHRRLFGLGLDGPILQHRPQGQFQRVLSLLGRGHSVQRYAFRGICPVGVLVPRHVQALSLFQVTVQLQLLAVRGRRQEEVVLLVHLLHLDHRAALGIAQGLHRELRQLFHHHRVRWLRLLRGFSRLSRFCRFGRVSLLRFFPFRSYGHG